MTKSSSSRSRFVSIDHAPEALKALPPLRKARAMALLQSLSPNPEFADCYYFCGEPRLFLDQAIEDLLVAGLIELGAEGSSLAIRIAPSLAGAEASKEAA